MKVSIVDTRASNQRSLENALTRIGVAPTLATNPDQLESADVIFLPGVGAFGPAALSLRKTGMDAAIRRRCDEQGVPLVGICLGMQLLATRSEENGSHQGLGLIEGTVKLLDPRESDNRVPNIGWCDVTAARTGQLFDAGGDPEAFYFVHSYFFDVDSDQHIAATTDYGDTAIPVAVERDNIYGMQFHPEKSQDAGLDLLARILGKIRETVLQ
tara:strand:- start:312 stop:950 length:639 start_codon:yes stop_codon:yes gene_type:complete